MFYHSLSPLCTEAPKDWYYEVQGHGSREGQDAVGESLHFSEEKNGS